MSEERIREILEAFETVGSYRREEVQAAMELKEQITPFLIEIVETVASNPSEYADRPGYFAHMYAIMLLGHFREPRSHEAIVKLAGLPNGLAKELLGDTITEDLRTILYRTCGESLESIKSLALSEDADEYSRGAALDAMVFAVAEGMVSREEVVSFFSAILDHLNDSDSKSLVWSQLADAACDLYPEELMEKLKDAYDKGLIDSWTVSYEDQEEALEGSVDASLESVRKKLERRSLDDLHKRMSWWACFKPGREALAYETDVEKSHRKKSKKTEKTKRKTAKASRKKNRRP